ncbi:hypothetical protein BN14_06948 [Rhizoctonia solani AG-1 IB]|uniref:C3H1-type domain-containing protein n=1 Tax=Thanatephorus cucumeris (strain AG1-IB / isolate 7/3/14) TaxID=1108050 RepID=M5C0G0_THACB|nr:hypothetical protein BN14_06948 [Rhizoctonia solani AG-1 IB]
MPLVRCIDGEDCRRRDCRFVHPKENDWQYAAESNLAKKRRAQAAATGHGSRESGYQSRPKGGRDSNGRGSITSSTSGWGDTSSGVGVGGGSGSGGWASPERPRRDPSPLGWGNTSSGCGWGASNSGGWGNTSTNDSGWGAPSGDSGFGNTSSSAWGESLGNVWGKPESSSRPNSSFSAPKSPVRPSSSPRSKDKSPSRHSQSSKDKDPDKDQDKDKDRLRERSREKDRHRDRDKELRHDRASSSPSRSSRSRQRSPSPVKPSSKPPSHGDSQPSKSNASTAANDDMDVDPPNPSSSTNKDSTAASIPGTTATTEPPPSTTEMPISIPFSRAREPSSAPPVPPGFGVPTAPRTTPSVPLSQSSMPPPPPPLGAPPAIPPPPPPGTTPITSSASKSPPEPQSSDATKVHALPTRPSNSTSQSPPQTSSLATPMVLPHEPKSSVTPTTPATPMTPVASEAHALSTPASTSVERPYEWIESLESLIKQNRVLQNCKQQYARAETQERMLAHRYPGAPKRSVGNSAPSLSDMRHRIETTERELQALLAQFASRMDVFYRPTEAVKHVDQSKGDEETLSMARRLSDQVSKLESEMQLLHIDTVKSAEMKKLDESIQTGSQAIKKEREERVKAVDDVKKDVKVLGDDLNRSKIECERLREDLVANGSNIDQIRCDTQVVRDGQVVIKEEVNVVKLEVETTKTDVQTVKTKMTEVDQEVTNIKAEVEMLKTKLATPPPTPRPSVPVPTMTPGKRGRNGIVAHDSNAMEIDDALPPAKRVRKVSPLRPSPFADSTTPLGSPKPVRFDGPGQKDLLERMEMLEDLVETLQGDVRQVEDDFQDQMQEFRSLGLFDEHVTNNVVSTTQTRSESAPPGPPSTRMDTARAAGRSSAPPSRTTFPVSWGPSTLPTVDELPSDDAIGTLRVDLDAMMGQVVSLWKGEGDWPAQVQKNLCKALGVESLDDAFKPAPAPPPPAVNGKKTPEPQEDWMMMLKNMQEEQARMRDAMKRERTEQDNRMKDVLSRLERAEQELDKSVKRKDEVERECELLKGQQAEQRQLLLHLQSVVDGLPKPTNGLLSPEGLLQDAMRNGASPVQQELAALRKLATTVPHLLALAGLSPEKEN